MCAELYHDGLQVARYHALIAALNRTCDTFEATTLEKDLDIESSDSDGEMEGDRLPVSGGCRIGCSPGGCVQMKLMLMVGHRYL